jgi:hypothetical protein
MNQSGIMCDHQYLFLMTNHYYAYMLHYVARSQHRGREAVNTVEIVPISDACLAAVAATNN